MGVLEIVDRPRTRARKPGATSAVRSASPIAIRFAGDRDMSKQLRAHHRRRGQARPENHTVEIQAGTEAGKMVPLND